MANQEVMTNKESGGKENERNENELTKTCVALTTRQR